MSNTARWAEPHMATFFADSVREWGGGDTPPIVTSGSQEGVEAGEFLTCYALNMGGTCNVLQKPNLSLKKAQLSPSPSVMVTTVTFGSSLHFPSC